MQTLFSAYLAATITPSVPTTDEDRFRDIGPGFAGFVATAVMVVVVILLIVDMMRRIRRIRYQSEQQERQAEMVLAGEEEAADREARRATADETGPVAGSVSSPEVAEHSDDEPPRR